MEGIELKSPEFAGMRGAYAAMFTPIAPDGSVNEAMFENENWSYRKAMMKYIGLDCGPYRYPYAPLTDDEYAAFAKRIDALGILKKA